MARLKRVVVPAQRSTTDVRGGQMGSRGAGAANFLLIGNSPFDAPNTTPYDGTYRSYVLYDVDAAIADKVPGGWGGVKVIRTVYFSYYTRHVTNDNTFPSNNSYFDVGGNAKVRLSRLTADPHFGSAGDGLIQQANPPIDQSHWADADVAGINPFSDTSPGSWEEFVTPTDHGETRVRANAIVGAWAPSSAGGHQIFYFDPEQGATLVRAGNPAHWTDTHDGYVNHGVLLRTPDENAGEQRAEFYSDSAANTSYQPTLTILYEPWDPAPDKPRIISPKGATAPDFEFRAYIPEPDPGDPIESVTLEVRSADNGGGTQLWKPTILRSVAWPDGEFRAQNPGQPTIPVAQSFWQLKSKTRSGASSALTDWQGFTLSRARPTVALDPLGTLPAFSGRSITGALTFSGAAHRLDVEVNRRLPDGHPLWRSNIWATTEEPPHNPVMQESAPTEPSQPTFHDGLPGAVAPPPIAAPAGTPDAVGIFRIYNAAPVHLGFVKSAFNDHFTYPVELVQDRLFAQQGYRHPKIVFTDLTNFIPGRTVWGYTSPDGIMHVEVTLRNDATHPTRVQEVILSEFCHVIDRFGVSNTQRNRIKDLMGVPTNYGWRPPPPSGTVFWQDIPAECFMDVVLKIFSDITLTITGFKYGLNHHKADIKTVLLKGYNPPPPPTCDPGFHWDADLMACVADVVHPPGTGTMDVIYGGPALTAGEYSVRARVADEFQQESAWAYDHTLVVTNELTAAVAPVLPIFDDPNVIFDDPNVAFNGPADPNLALIPNIEIDYSARPAALVPKVRIVLRALDQPTHAEGDTQKVNPGANQYSRGPGTLKAIIEDGQHVGMSAYAATPGELHFTLPQNHAQISECVPWQRHYELQQLDKYGNWDTKSEGLLHEVDTSTDDAIIYGWDYLGLLALSVESAHPPDSNDDAPIDPAPGKAKGSKYIQKNISFIINDQIQRGIDDVDSPIGWIELAGEWPSPDRDDNSMPEPTTIFASFVQRLQFIRGLLDSYNSGTGNRSRIMARRDEADGNKIKFYVMEDSGRDRANLRLEYGSILQGFEVIAFGDFAVKVLAIGHRPLNVKPLFAERNAAGLSTQVWGNIARTALWQDIADEADLARRALQRAAEFGRIGKAAAVAVRVRGLDPNDGWEITDAIPLAIKRGPIETRFWTPDSSDDALALSWWVIWGYEWRIEPDGHDELVLILRPRIDNGTPLPDTVNHPLLKFVQQHTSPEWAVPTAPGVSVITGVDADYNVGVSHLKGDGGDFLIRKLTQGTYFSSDTAGANVDVARSRGLVGGFYHFLSRVENANGDQVAFNTGDKQCDYFISKLPNQDPEGYLCALDVENNVNNNNPGGLPDKFTRQGVTYQPLKTGPKRIDVVAFVNRWKSLFPDHPLFIYSSAVMWGPHTTSAGNALDVKALFDNAFCWNALWQSHASLFKNQTDTFSGWSPGWGGFSNAIILQYGTANLTGGSTPDGDISRRSQAELLTYTTSFVGGGHGASYATGWNAIIAADVAAVPGLDGGTGDADHDSGVADARAAILDTLSTMPIQ